MKRLLFIGLTTIAINNYAQKANSVDYAKTITETELKEHLYIYASDEFEGRETGKPGQKKAVNYIKKQYENMGVAAAKADGNYFQEVPLEYGALPEVQFAIAENNYVFGEHFLTFSGSGNVSINANEIVFAGYGIDDANYSDYSDIDVDGKIVFIKSGEPKNEDGTYLISGTEAPSKWSNIRQAFENKISLVSEKGAKGLLFYDPDNFSLLKQQYTYLKNQSNKRMRLKPDVKNDFFYLFINDSIAQAIGDIKSFSSNGTLIKTNIDVTYKQDSSNTVSSENVVAYIKGSEKPEEYIVISSHLDHIGITNGQINNGADDDGSGTVALIEIAEAFKEAVKNGHRPKRSIVFLHVTGEEKGLFGSEYYTMNPIFPLENTVANLNIDMIGRVDPKREGDRNYIYLIGSDKLSTELHNISEEINKKYTNLTFDYKYNDENDPNRFYYRSDHYNFAKNNVPVIFYFNGTHADYHKPSDTPDKIEYDLLAKRAQLIFYTAWELANRENRIIVDKATVSE
ncbi:M28 family metallopeptidase [Leptobacterium sp. I13]|uniref:M28 family metallopeptidase n=1 Tax=Leptobacterium meishanense TaxID=3128904 RepID=UPI0030EDB80D